VWFDTLRCAGKLGHVGRLYEAFGLRFDLITMSWTGDLSLLRSLVIGRLCRRLVFQMNMDGNITTIVDILSLCLKRRRF
jgi:hypothetical protein